MLGWNLATSATVPLWWRRKLNCCKPSLKERWSSPRRKMPSHLRSLISTLTTCPSPQAVQMFSQNYLPSLRLKSCWVSYKARWANSSRCPRTFNQRWTPWLNSFWSCRVFCRTSNHKASRPKFLIYSTPRKIFFNACQSCPSRKRHR